MRSLILPLPSIDQLDIEINDDTFAEEYMRYLEIAVEKISGVRLRYEMPHIKEKRVVARINITDLPSFASACELDYGFERAVLDGINNHKDCGSEDHPEADWAKLNYYDMRKWPDTWISAYLWVILKVDFLRKHNIKLGITNADFIGELVAGINNEVLPLRHHSIAIEVDEIAKTYLDRDAHKQILNNLAEKVLSSPFAFRAELITVNEAVSCKGYGGVIEEALASSLRLTTLLAQEIKENANFFETTTSMRSLKMPMPALSTLDIKTNHQEFAYAYLLMLSEIIAHRHETRLHYTNVRVTDDHVYADINLKRLPAIDDEFGEGTLDAINSHELSGTDLCPIANWDMLKHYDIRRLPDLWLTSFLSEHTRAAYKSWEKKPSSFSHNDMIAAIVAEAGSIEPYRHTLQDTKDSEFKDAQDEYAVGDPRSTVEVLVDFGNALINACNKANLPAIETVSGSKRHLPTDALTAVIDNYADALMRVSAEQLWRIREDDEHIKHDHYFW